MGLADIVRDAIVAANGITTDLLAPVTYYAWTGVDGYGKPTFASGVEKKAVVDFRQKKFKRTATGEEIQQVAVVTFIEAFAAHGASGRREPIDPRDKIVLPNGYTGPILEVSGPIDPTTSLPFMLEVALG